MTSTVLQKPILKWIGGKTQIIDTIISKIPKEIENYHEPFLGGGSVLFAVLSLQKSGKINIKNKIYAYDYNPVLINVYNHIKNNKEELFLFIEKYINEYHTLTGTEVNRNPTTEEEAKMSKESYYYWIRNKYNTIEKNTVECSALFMFLNKTCFRGMYREGPKGFNVPYGHYKKTPVIIKQQDLNTISELIKDVEFIHSDFRDSIKKIKPSDFVYFDHPYAQENKNSFVDYVADGFTLEMHKTLFAEIKNMTGVKFVLSNAKVNLVIESFGDYNCEDIKARRAINSKNPAATTTEVIIYN